MPCDYAKTAKHSNTKSMTDTQTNPKNPPKTAKLEETTHRSKGKEQGERGQG